MPTLDLACTNTRTLRVASLVSTQDRFYYRHRQVAIYKRFDWWWQTPTPTLNSLHKYAFLLRAYRSVSLTRTQHYTQLVYLFHKCSTTLRIADCTVRHPGVERPFLNFSTFFGIIIFSIFLLSPNFLYFFCIHILDCPCIISRCYSFCIS